MKCVFCCTSAFVVLSMALSGCFTLWQNAMHGRVRGEHFTYRDPVRIDADKLKLQGYYSLQGHYSGGEFHDNSQWPDTVWHPLVLWEDGTALYASKGALSKEAYEEQDFENGHEAYLYALEDLSGERNNNESWVGHWGAFRIRGNSISVQIMYNRVSFSKINPSYAVEYNGEILNDTTFVFIERIHRFEPVGLGGIDRDTAVIEQTYRFHPLRKKPDSTNWTKTHPELQ